MRKNETRKIKKYKTKLESLRKLDWKKKKKPSENVGGGGQNKVQLDGKKKQTNKTENDLPYSWKQEYTLEEYTMIFQVNF